VTCTKFHLWSLTQFERIIYLDADALVVGNIDEVLMLTSANFAAAPDTYPPDTFNRSS
jgi:alpha-N-acetylglucosamine transferase